jgi:hypothetical protein
MLFHFRPDTDIRTNLLRNHFGTWIESVGVDKLRVYEQTQTSYWTMKEVFSRLGFFHGDLIHQDFQL